MPHGETVSPDRKAIYESSMRKTGGKMNADCEGAGAALSGRGATELCEIFRSYCKNAG